MKHIGWVSRSSQTKHMSPVVIEFREPEDTNRIIDEALIWQGEVVQYKRYGRRCCLKQCFHSHKSHSGRPAMRDTTPVQPSITAGCERISASGSPLFLEATVCEEGLPET
jgi:hypothetical protein